MSMAESGAQNERTMKIHEITLEENEVRMLREITAMRNHWLGQKTRMSCQEYAAELLKDVIYSLWKMMRSEK